MALQVPLLVESIFRVARVPINVLAGIIFWLYRGWSFHIQCESISAKGYLWHSGNCGNCH